MSQQNTKALDNSMRTFRNAWQRMVDNPPRVNDGTPVKLLPL
jgi:hypothetical protein